MTGEARVAVATVLLAVAVATVLLAVLTGLAAGPAEGGAAAGDCGTPAAVGSVGDDRTFFGHDDRERVPAAEYPWSAIGKLLFESGGYCTGALVAARVVLTAAHCLYAPDGGSAIDAPAAFYAGLDGTHAAARAAAVSFYRSPRYDNYEHARTSRIDGLDWAFVALDRDLGRIAGTLPVRNLSTAELRRAVDHRWTVIQAGYPADDPDHLWAHIGCPIVRVLDNDTVFHECDTLRGDSGSPLFVEIEGRYQIVAVTSAIYPNRQGRYDINMAVDSRAFYGELGRFLESVQRGSTAPLRRRGQGRCPCTPPRASPWNPLRGDRAGRRLRRRG